ncbi:unnamed protein product [Polarella glacialis]|uniref:Cyclin-dependent kinase 2 homolog n=1 Tax=Polarella glacialis TaxID=89957 RepID=A0A813I6H6_POLGL|nr:unnamed protein product [Polarella glacialis]
MGGIGPRWLSTAALSTAAALAASSSCDFQRLSGKQADEAVGRHAARPVVLTGLLDSWPARQKWASAAAFAELYGELPGYARDHDQLELRDVDTTVRTYLQAHETCQRPSCKVADYNWLENKVSAIWDLQTSGFALAFSMPREAFATVDGHFDSSLPVRSSASQVIGVDSRLLDALGGDFHTPLLLGRSLCTPDAGPVFCNGFSMRPVSDGAPRLAVARCSVVPDAAIEDLAAGGVDSTAAGSDQMADQDEDDAEIKGQYTFEEIIGSGSYGTVFKAINKTTGRRVAIKKMYGMQADEGVPATALREIALLKDLSHVNVIRLYEVFSGPRYMHLVVEFLDMDLRVYLKQHGPLQDAWLKSAAQQCFAGLAHCHGRLVLHRDLKPQNVLVDIRERRLVLADLGLARHFTVPLKVYTHEVATLWYRSIEILLGQQMYGPSMDVSSLGCIVAEMATGRVLFPSDSEIDTIFRILRLLGDLS